MIIVTGAAGFIGSVLIGRLNKEGFNAIIAVDDFSQEDKIPNLLGKSILQAVHRDDLMHFVIANQQQIEFVFHIGARTDTTEFDEAIFERMNIQYSKDLFELCTQYQIPIVYASSAATYGLGESGYEDDETRIKELMPLNPYGWSKQKFDLWVLEQERRPFFWAGLKFFNVYGPNEYHKRRMASVIFHAHRQITESNSMKLFRSHHKDYSDGGQMRDFVYVKDLVEVCLFLMYHRKHSGIYNLGSGIARTFLDLAQATFKAMDKTEEIDFIDTPLDIRDKYQYYTQADMGKLKEIGYDLAFHSLEDGVDDYVKNYLTTNSYY
jgi:ADP-L-glycero-D-manno-heptose 6-epimerase